MPGSPPFFSLRPSGKGSPCKSGTLNASLQHRQSPAGGISSVPHQGPSPRRRRDRRRRIIALGPMARFSEKIGHVPDKHKEKDIDKHDHEGIGGWTEHLQAPCFTERNLILRQIRRGGLPALCYGYQPPGFMTRLIGSLRRGRERGSRPDPPGGLRLGPPARHGKPERILPSGDPIIMGKDGGGKFGINCEI